MIAHPNRRTAPPSRRTVGPSHPTPPEQRPRFAEGGMFAGFIANVMPLTDALRAMGQAVAPARQQLVIIARTARRSQHIADLMRREFPDVRTSRVVYVANRREGESLVPRGVRIDPRNDVLVVDTGLTQDGLDALALAVTDPSLLDQMVRTGRDMLTTAQQRSTF